MAEIQIPSIQTTFGPSLIGAMITAMLYGLTTLQTYMYFANYPKDGVGLKSLVSAIWVLDSFHISLVCVTMYHYLIDNYNNPPALLIGHWSTFLSICMNLLIAVLVQSFFTMQIFYLAGHRIRWALLAVISIAVLAHFAFGLESVVILFMRKEFSSFQEHHVTVIAATPFGVFAVLSDILITISLCVLLYGNRSEKRSTNTIISTLIIYAVNRCLLTSVVAVIETIVFSIFPTSLWFLAIDFVIGKLYANSLLASLNSRNSLRAVSIRSQNSRGSNSVTANASLAFQRGPATSNDTGTAINDGEPEEILIGDMSHGKNSTVDFKV